MQLPALAATENLDLGRTLLTAAQLKNAGLQNRMMEAGIAKEQQLSEVRNNMLSGGASAGGDGSPVSSDMMKRYLALDPKGGKQIIDALSTMSEDQRKALDRQNRIGTQLLLGVESAPEAQRPQAYAQALKIAEQNNIPIANAPAEYDPLWTRQQTMLGLAVDDFIKMQKPTGTTAMQNAEAAGFKPGTPEYREFIAKATNKALVNVNMGNKVAEKMLDLDVDTVKGYREVATGLDDLAPRLELVAQGLESGVETGRFQEAMLPLKQWLDSAGYKVDESLPQQEQVNSAMAYLVPRMRVAGSGSTSDREMAMFKQAAPNFSNSTQGNILIARTMLQTAKRNKRYADMAAKYLRSNRNLEGFDEKAEKELGPLFPRPQTENDYTDIPKGTVYIHPDGKFKVKR